MAMSKGKASSAALGSGLAAVLLLAGARPAEAAPPGKGDPIVLPVPAGIGAAAAAIEAATGAKGEPIEKANGAVPEAEGRSFPMDGATAARLLAGSHAPWRTAGLYLFRVERSYGMAGDKDHLAVLVAPDRTAVIRRVGTSGPGGVTPDRIVAFLDALEKDEPFDLLEIGVDYVAGRFRSVPSDPAAMARRLAAFAPQLAAGQHAQMLDLLAQEIRTNRTLYLFW